MATILLVDQSPITRSVIQIYMKGLPYRILETDRAARALELIEKDAVDLVITDHLMPDLGGLELVEKIRGRKAAKPIPVIILTGDRSIDLERRARVAGAAALLRKPVSGAGLLERVREILGESSYVPVAT